MNPLCDLKYAGKLSEAFPKTLRIRPRESIHVDGRMDQQCLKLSIPRMDVYQRTYYLFNFSEANWAIKKFPLLVNLLVDIRNTTPVDMFLRRDKFPDISNPEGRFLPSFTQEESVLDSQLYETEKPKFGIQRSKYLIPMSFPGELIFPRGYHT